jgi:hypothetical protein
VRLASTSDYVILLLGINTTIESEGQDRTSIDLPDIQHYLAAAVLAAKKPTVMVVFNGGMVSIAEEKVSVPAILGAGYPGIWGAGVIAETIFGDNDNLGGKLPYTIYPKEYVDEILMTEMEMDVGPGRSYRYYTGTPIYPFGYGISLTNFTLTLTTSSAEVDMPTSKGVTAVFTTIVNVTNTGTRTGDEIVFYYVVVGSLTVQTENTLIKKLINYKRVHLASGESTAITRSFTQNDFRMLDRSGNIVSTPGTYTLLITNGVDLNVSVPVKLVGDEVMVEKFPIY